VAAGDLAAPLVTFARSAPRCDGARAALVSPGRAAPDATAFTCYDSGRERSHTTSASTTTTPHATFLQHHPSHARVGRIPWHLFLPVPTRRDSAPTVPPMHPTARYHSVLALHRLSSLPPAGSLFFGRRTMRIRVRYGDITRRRQRYRAAHGRALLASSLRQTARVCTARLATW